MPVPDFSKQMLNEQESELTEITFPIPNADGELEYTTFTDFKILNNIEALCFLYIESKIHRINKEISKAMAEERDNWIETLLSKERRKCIENLSQKKITLKMNGINKHANKM